MPHPDDHDPTVSPPPRPADYELMRAFRASLAPLDAITIQGRKHTDVEVSIPIGPDQCFEVVSRLGVAKLVLSPVTFPVAEPVTIETMTVALAQAIAHRVSHGVTEALALSRWGDLLAKPLPLALRNALASQAAEDAKARIEAANNREARAFAAITTAMEDRAAAKHLSALADEVRADTIRRLREVN